MSRILIADDEPGVLEVITVLLEDQGHMVQTAPDGLAALKMIADNPPDLFITDVLMPRLDGWLLLNFVRERAPLLPVIIISAADPMTTRLDLFAADHTVFLRKPFDNETLLATVARLTTS